jgi:two-component system, LytTR family, response regulator LytT
LKIRVMVGEDERLAREELVYLIEQEEDCVICGVAENGEQVLELGRQENPDLIFLDIHMPHMTGLDAAKILFTNKVQNKRDLPLLVFTTAYDEYAIAAFGVEASDYLLKPYDATRFRETMARIRRQLTHLQIHVEPQKITETVVKKDNLSSINLPFQKLLVDEGDKLVIISEEEILYAVRQERLIEIHTEKEVVQAKWTLQELEQKLRGLPFYRPHRSYLVNLNFVHEIIPWFNGAYTIVLDDKDRTNIPVSRSSAKELFEILGQ